MKTFKEFLLEALGPADPESPDAGELVDYDEVFGDTGQHSPYAPGVRERTIRNIESRETGPGEFKSDDHKAKLIYHGKEVSGFLPFSVVSRNADANKIDIDIMHTWTGNVVSQSNIDLDTGNGTHYWVPQATSASEREGTLPRHVIANIIDRHMKSTIQNGNHGGSSPHQAHIFGQ